MARVKVTNRHPRLDDVIDKGLQSLDGWRETAPIKTHVVLIRFAGGIYEIQARQHDGLTSVVSPLRQERTDSRDGVSRTIALMIKHDFGLVGARPVAAGSRQALGAGGDQGRGTGRCRSVAGLTRVRSSPWSASKAVLPGSGCLGPCCASRRRLAEGGGVCTCHRLFYRFDPNPALERRVSLPEAGHEARPLARPRGAGKGPTTRRSRWQTHCLVEIGSAGHHDDRGSMPHLQALPVRNGVIDTGDEETYDHVAFVKVLVEPAAAKVPVPIVDDRADRH